MSAAARAILLGAVLAVTAGAVAAQTPEELFERGNAAYQDGRFDEAARAYESVLRFGIVDARVEYNLGNARFKQGELGRAILHYERAYRLDPTDPDVRANLELARSRRFDRVERAPTPAALRILRSAQNAVGPDRQALAVLALVWIAAGIVTWAAARPGGFSPAAGWTLVAAAVLAAAIGLSWYVTWERLEGKPLAVVLEPAVEVLAGPGENNAAVFTVHEGLTVEIRSERAEWIQVSLPNGLNGWVRRSAVGRV